MKYLTDQRVGLTKRTSSNADSMPVPCRVGGLVLVSLVGGVAGNGAKLEWIALKRHPQKSGKACRTYAVRIPLGFAAMRLAARGAWAPVGRSGGL